MLYRLVLTAVATKMGSLPERKFFSASSLCLCVRSPWIEFAGYPSCERKLCSESAPCLVSTNTRVSESADGTAFEAEPNNDHNLVKLDFY